MTPLERMKETCKVLGIALPITLLAMSAPQSTETKRTKEEMQNNLNKVTAAMHKYDFGGSHVNRHSNYTRKGHHTDQHSNTSTVGKSPA